MARTSAAGGLAVAGVVIGIAALPPLPAASPPGASQASGAEAISIPYAEARPILESLRSELLPAALRPDAESTWPEWAARHDAATRERVGEGDDESVVNLMLFGTSFTMRPRATERDLAELAGQTSRSELVAARMEDLMAGMVSPDGNARLQFAREVIARHHIDVDTPAGREAARRHLTAGLSRMAQEIAGIDRAVTVATQTGRPGSEQLARSTLFRDRGLASDTSIFSSFAIDRALDGLASTKTLAAGSVRRVAIVGPGLDFIDKRDGYDFYPEQTLQPLAVADSLRRYGLASAGLAMTTLDVNPRVNEHIAGARARALAGAPYVVALARDLDLAWTSRLADYWERFGEHVGTSAESVRPPPSAGRLRVRAVRVGPTTMLSIVPRDLNIVLQRLDPLGTDERFDLVVATDVLIYYDAFEQSLALANVARMLRPGGILLSNVTLAELPAIPMSSIGFSDVLYLAQPEIGDRVVWYQRQ